MNKMIAEFKMMKDMALNLRKRYQLVSIDYTMGTLAVHMTNDIFDESFGKDYVEVDKYEHEYLWLEHYEDGIRFFTLKERGMDLREKFFFLTEKAKSHDA